MGSNSIKNSHIKVQKQHAYLRVIERKSEKFPINPMKDVEGVKETRFLAYKVYVSMGNNC